MLPSSDDANDMVVKRLPIPVGDYLDQGLPEYDYSQKRDWISTYQTDLDVEEMFNKFPLHYKERHTMGVRYIKTIKPNVQKPHDIMRWSVLNFGCRVSPYLACQGQARILECCTSDRHNAKNPFQWEYVRLNLPTSLGYDPSLPRVLLLRKDNKLATRQKVYVDDIHIAGRGQWPTNHASKYLSSKMNYYGNQESVRKRRFADLCPGAWRGKIISTSEPQPLKSTTGKKWSRLRSGLQWIISTAETSTKIDTAELRRICGLAVNVTEVYPLGRSFLKGLFNCIESWRPN